MTKVLGLTGGIATGKTAVAKLFLARGAVVIDADQVAHQVVQKGQPGLTKVIEVFGTGILTPTGELDRAKLGKIVFADAHQLELLNAATHPLIREQILAAIADYQAQGYPLVVADVPLLLESDYRSICDAVLVTDIPLDMQVRRVMSRDHLTSEAAQQRINSQLDRRARLDAADFVIDTSGNLVQLESTFDELWESDKFQKFLIS